MRHQTILRRFLPAALLGLVASPVQSQQDFDAAIPAATQREAMEAFAVMDGVWRGSAWTLLPSGERHELVQTERVGPLLGGAIRLLEGRGYEADGRLGFDALGIISYDSARQACSMRSYAMGRSGDFEITVEGNRFRWEIPAGPMTIRYEATVDGETWTEIGTRIVPGSDPVRFFEAHLTRVGDTDWPSAGAVGPE